jgi:hypothetical protein
MRAPIPLVEGDVRVLLCSKPIHPAAEAAAIANTTRRILFFMVISLKGYRAHDTQAIVGRSEKYTRRVSLDLVENTGEAEPFDAGFDSRYSELKESPGEVFL